MPKGREEVFKKLAETDLKINRLVSYAISLLEIERSNAGSRTILEKIESAEISEKSRFEVTNASNIHKRKLSCIEDEESPVEVSRLKMPKMGTITKNQVSNTSKYKSARKENLLSKSRFKTPMKVQKPKIPTDDKPLIFMRRPAQGEMVVSVCGSPLLVSTVFNEERPNVNIPMANGQLLALFPMQMENLKPDNVPEFDADTKKQLKMLAENLTKICNMSK